MKTVIITGGSTGIGSAMVKLFAQNSYNVIFTYNSSADAAEMLEHDLVSKGFSAAKFKCDVRKSDDIKTLVDFTVNKYSEIDTVIANAGISAQKLLYDITDDDFNNMIATHLGGTFYLFREASPQLINQKSGNLIAVSSYFGEIGGAMESHYSMAKGGIISFVKALAKELGPSNIRVNSISPGVIDTNMLCNLSSADKDILTAETPLEKIGSPLDVANAALFLASDKARFITGHNLSVSGGINIV